MPVYLNRRCARCGEIFTTNVEAPSDSTRAGARPDGPDSGQSELNIGYVPELCRVCQVQIGNNKEKIKQLVKLAINKI